MGNFEDDLARQAREQQRCKIDLSVVSFYPTWVEEDAEKQASFFSAWSILQYVEIHSCSNSNLIVTC